MIIFDLEKSLKRFSFSNVFILYLKSIPRVLASSILACCMTVSIFFLIDIFTSHDSSNNLIPPFFLACLFVVIFGHMVMGPFILLVYLPLALLFKSIGYRIIFLPLLALAVCLAGIYFLSAVDLFTFPNEIVVIPLLTAFFTGTLHHFFMKKPTTPLSIDIST